MPKTYKSLNKKLNSHLNSGLNHVLKYTKKFTPDLHQKIEKKRRDEVKSFKAKMDHNRTFTDRIADQVTRRFGSTIFFILNLLFFSLWIVWNNGWIPGASIFDPYPYGMLTMVVSLEAIFLSIFVLISQNRAAKTADLREELDLQLNIQAEEEITKVLVLVDEIHDHLGLSPEDDADLRRMKQKTDLLALEKQISQEMDEAE